MRDPATVVCRVGFGETAKEATTQALDKLREKQINEAREYYFSASTIDVAYFPETGEYMATVWLDRYPRS